MVLDKSFDEHLKNLEEVFQRLIEQNRIDDKLPEATS